MGVELPNAFIFSIGIEDCGSDYPLTISSSNLAATSAAEIARRC
jgi:hypothetical protein